jgi:hypothetical protein
LSSLLQPMPGMLLFVTVRQSTPMHVYDRPN